MLLLGAESRPFYWVLLAHGGPRKTTEWGWDTTNYLARWLFALASVKAAGPHCKAQCDHIGCTGLTPTLLLNQLMKIPTSKGLFKSGTEDQSGCKFKANKPIWNASRLLKASAERLSTPLISSPRYLPNKLPQAFLLLCFYYSHHLIKKDTVAC